MKIVVIGGGPAGLYFAILMKQRIRATRSRLRAQPPRRHLRLGRRLLRPDPRQPGRRRSRAAGRDRARASPIGTTSTSTSAGRVDHAPAGHGFSGIARKRLLEHPPAARRALGVDLRFETEVEHRPRRLGRDADLVVGADGVNSGVRQPPRRGFPARARAPAQPVTSGSAPPGPSPPSPSSSRRPSAGWFQAHAYRFEDDALGLHRRVRPSRLAQRRLRPHGPMTRPFAPARRCSPAWLDGHPLRRQRARPARGSAWINFPRGRCDAGSTDNVVLIGDAAHTAHFSIGSGTKLAMEDAIALARLLSRPRPRRGRRSPRLRGRAQDRGAPPAERRPQLDGVVRERPPLRRLEPEQFAYSLLTRSQRVSHENLRLRDEA